MDEFKFIIDFARNEDLGYDVCYKQLRSLWTAYCLHNNIECDTGSYDSRLCDIYHALKKNTSCPLWVDEETEMVNFNRFDNYMCENIV